MAQEYEVSLHMALKRRVQAASKEAAIEEYKRVTGVRSSDHPFQVVAIPRTVAPVPDVPPLQNEPNTKPVMRLEEYASAKGLETAIVVAAAKDMNFDSAHPSSGLSEEEIQLLDEYLDSK